MIATTKKHKKPGPAHLNSIPAQTFNNCKRLKEITLPEGVKTISESAFGGSGLEKIDLPNTLQTIGSSAFANCEDLKSGWSSIKESNRW
jgi:hypothetical protein